MLDQQSGAEIEPLTVQDIRIDHLPEFFDTMLARSYVGYGASTLGGADAGSTNPQPRQQLGDSGHRGTSFLQQAFPMPGAMMNHFVIANWYDPEMPAIMANDNVKIMKYYSGAEISGTVMTGSTMGWAYLMLEYSSSVMHSREKVLKTLMRIPIGFQSERLMPMKTVTGVLGSAGRIRVSAFAGVFDDTFAIQEIQSGNLQMDLVMF